MNIEITWNYQYSINKELRREHDGHLEEKTMFEKNITKESIDKLIEEIDKILKKASV